MIKTIFNMRVFIAITILLGASIALALFTTCKKAVQQPIKSVRIEVDRTEIDRGEIIAGQLGANYMMADNYAYRQDDPAWASHKIGNTTDSLEHYGCTIASVAVAASNLLGTEITPEDMNTRLGNVDGFTDRGWLIWRKIKTSTSGELNVSLDPTPTHEAIDQCMVSNGYPVIKIKLRGQIIHWVVIVGKNENEYLIRDPLVGDSDDLPIKLSSRSDQIFASRCVTLNTD